MGYELLEDNLTKSTLWMFGSKDAKLLMITILSECHGSERCRVPVPVLVKLAGLTREEGEIALAELEAPDPSSRCRDKEGRRIVRESDDEGTYLFLPSYRARRNRYLANERKKEFKRNDTERPGTVENEEERPGTVENEEERPGTPGNGKERSGTVRNAKFDLESDTEADTEKKEEKKRFAPPTLDEAKAYFAEKGLNGDAEAFFWNHDSKGWRGITSWKASAMYWSRNQKQFDRKVSQPAAPRSHDASSQSPRAVLTPDEQKRLDAVLRGENIE